MVNSLLKRLERVERQTARSGDASDLRAGLEAAEAEESRGFSPVRSVVEFGRDIGEATAGAIRGQQDPAFEGVRGFTGEGIRDPEVLSAVQRAKVGGVSDKAFGRLVKEALGNRIIQTEKDRFGQEVITFRDDEGKIRREFINKPGLDFQDVDRGISASVPALVGGVVGRGFGLGARLGIQVPLQGGISAGQDLAAGEEIDPVKLGAASGGALAGELASPVFQALKQVFTRTPQLVQTAADGSLALTAQGREVLRQAGIPEEQVTPEFLTQLTSPDIPRTGDQAQGAIRSQTDEFGIRSSQGQRTKDPEALLIEEEARRRVLGQQAQGVALDFDRGQRGDVRQAVTGIAEGFGGQRPATVGAAGQTFQSGLQEAESAGSAAISKAFNDVDIPAIFPGGIPRNSFRSLEEGLDEALTTVPLGTELTPATEDTVRLLRNFAQGRARRPSTNLLGRQKQGRVLTFDEVRRQLNRTVGAAANPTDLLGATRVKQQYNQWLERLANDALDKANPEEFAKLQAAIGLTARVKSLFEARGVNDKAGRLIRDILDKADSPEGAINTIIPSGFKTAPKTGAVAAVERLKKILRVEQPDAWHAMRQAYWLKLTRGNRAIFKEGEISRREFDTALGQIHRNINDALDNQGSLIGVLFSKDEIKRMRAFGRAVRRSQSENPNPSGTSFASQRMKQQARDSVLPNLLRRQAAGQQIRGNAVRATGFRFLTRRAVEILGQRGEGRAARNVGRLFSAELPGRPRAPSRAGIGAALAVQEENRER